MDDDDLTASVLGSERPAVAGAGPVAPRSRAPRPDPGPDPAGERRSVIGDHV